MSDVERSIEWYRDVLGFERRHPEWGEAPAMVCAGDTCVALFAVEGEPQAPPGRDALAMRHLAFRVDRPGFERAQEELRDRGIAFEFMDHETAHSIYFTDPDGHRLEITTYEPEPETIYRRAHDAFNRGDREAFLTLWHEDCEYLPALVSGTEGPEGVYRGRDGLRLFWETIHSEFTDLSSEIDEVHALRDGLLGVIVFRARGTASGALTEMRIAQRSTYREGKVHAARDHLDIEEAKVAAGL